MPASHCSSRDERRALFPPVVPSSVPPRGVVLAIVVIGSACRMAAEAGRPARTCRAARPRRPPRPAPAGCASAWLVSSRMRGDSPARRASAASPPARPCSACARPSTPGRAAVRATSAIASTPSRRLRHDLELGEGAQVPAAAGREKRPSRRRAARAVFVLICHAPQHRSRRGGPRTIRGITGGTAARTLDVAA